MRLGRGLDVLLPQKQAGVSSGGMREIKTDAIELGPHQARKNFPMEGLKSLAESIKTYGVLEPVLVSEKSEGRYILLAGERRLRACRMAGLEKIPAVVKVYNGKEAALVGLMENVQRQDLNCVELAAALFKMIEEFGLTHEQAASAVGFSRSRLSNLLRILQLPGEIKEYVIQGHLSEGQARAILSLGSEEERLCLARQIALEETPVSVRDIERKRKIRKKDSNIGFLEEKLQDVLKTKVRISHHSRKNTGWISIYYYSLEHFDGLYKQVARKGQEE